MRVLVLLKRTAHAGRDQVEKMIWAFFHKSDLLECFCDISGKCLSRLVTPSLGLIAAAPALTSPDHLPGKGYRIVLIGVLPQAVYALVVIAEFYLFFTRALVPRLRIENLSWERKRVGRRSG